MQAALRGRLDHKCVQTRSSHLVLLPGLPWPQLTPCLMATTFSKLLRIAFKINNSSVFQNGTQMILIKQLNLGWILSTQIGFYSLFFFNSHSVILHTHLPLIFGQTCLTLCRHQQGPGITQSVYIIQFICFQLVAKQTLSRIHRHVLQLLPCLDLFSHCFFLFLQV